MRGRWGGTRVVVCVLILAMARGLAAQDRPVVFLHGLGSNSNGWVDTAERLRQQTAIEPRLPDFNWRKSFQDQAGDVRNRPELAALTAPVLVGHSNGGLVAREWSRGRHVDGVVTIGTPHRGAPLMPNFFQWTSFNAAAPSLLNTTLRAFSDWTDFSWTFWYIQNALNWVADFSIWAVFSLGTTLGFDAALPVAGQMHPYSSYVSDVNSSTNLGREASDIPSRVGVVSVAHNFYWAGPARAAVPDLADGIAVALYGAAFGLEYWAGYIMIEADPSDFAATEQAFSLFTVASYILAIDPFYCRVVSTYGLNDCVENDGVVPYTSQEYPNAPNMYIGTDNDGPAHVQERQRSGDALYSALTWYMHIPNRGSTPTPTPPPPSPPAPGDPSPAPSGGSAPTGSFVMQPDQVLYPDDRIDSVNGLYHFVYQADGNLVLYEENWAPLWASHTDGSLPGLVIMQSDGNFVLYDGNGVALWASGSSVNHPGAYLIVQDDGNVVIYEAGGGALWATGTAR
ncbi:MAG: hypothetical protein ABI051_03740 [Vicinamibacterales bacterium]